MQERFNELKAMKAWLKPDLKDEYNALKLQLERDVPEVAGTGVQTKSEVVTMTKEELKQLLKEARTEAVESHNDALRLGEWTKKREDKKANRVATMRLYREDGLSEPGLIIDWRFVRNIEDPDTRKKDVPVYQITVKYDEEVKKYEIPLEEMVKINEFEKVEIIKQHIEDQELKQGVGQKPFTKSGYSFSSPGFFGTKQQESSEDFDYVVTRQDITCTIKRPNGETLDIHSSRLNQ